MSEPVYLELDWDEDFTMDAHVDSDGYQRVALMGYIYKRKADGVYRAPLLPDLFFGANGQQLHGSWRQYLSAGDQVILSRDGGNPVVRDSDLAWRKVSSAPQRPTRPMAPTRAEIPVMPILGLMGVAVGIIIIWKLMR